MRISKNHKLLFPHFHYFPILISSQQTVPRFQIRLYILFSDLMFTPPLLLPLQFSWLLQKNHSPNFLYRVHQHLPKNLR